MLNFFKKKAKTAEVPQGEVKTVALEKLLSEFAIGQSGVIKSIGGDGKIRRRLFDMGVTPGADVYLRKKAPLGDPLEVTLRGYELTLRKNEACVVLAQTEETVAVETEEAVSAGSGVAANVENEHSVADGVEANGAGEAAADVCSEVNNG